MSDTVTVRFTYRQQATQAWLAAAEIPAAIAAEGTDAILAHLAQGDWKDEDMHHVSYGDVIPGSFEIQEEQQPDSNQRPIACPAMQLPLPETLALLAPCGTVERWAVIEVSEENLPSGVVAVLEADPGVNVLRGQWQDLLIRHGDDGGWCVESTDPGVMRTLERVRMAHDYSDRSVFHLLIKRK